jgi:hypothetical protein
MARRRVAFAGDGAHDVRLPAAAKVAPQHLVARCAQGVWFAQWEARVLRLHVEPVDTPWQLTSPRAARAPPLFELMLDHG